MVEEQTPLVAEPPPAADQPSPAVEQPSAVAEPPEPPIVEPPAKEETPLVAEPPSVKQEPQPVGSPPVEPAPPTGRHPLPALTPRGNSRLTRRVERLRERRATSQRWYRRLGTRLLVLLALVGVGVVVWLLVQSLNGPAR